MADAGQREAFDAGDSRVSIWIELNAIPSLHSVTLLLPNQARVEDRPSVKEVVRVRWRRGRICLALLLVTH